MLFFLLVVVIIESIVLVNLYNKNEVLTKEIAELKKLGSSLKNSEQEKNLPLPQTPDVEAIAVSKLEEEKPLPEPLPEPLPVQEHAKPEFFKDPVWQANSALILGTFFIMLSGLIFSTTTWRILPNIGKIFVLMGSSLIFFLGSLIADKKFHIEKTSKAFYILGSVFIFVSIVGMGFFGLLGETLKPFGSDNMRLYFIAAFFTETALILGLKKFNEKPYAFVCLAGKSICFYLLLLSFKPKTEVLSILYSLYCVILIFSNEIFQKHKDKINISFVNSSVKDIFENFCYGNLFLASLIISFIFPTGLSFGITCFVLACTHIYFASARDDLRTDLSSVVLIILVGAGIYKMTKPETTSEIVLFLTGVLSLFYLLNYTKLLSERMKKITRVFIYALYGIIFCVYVAVGFFEPTIEKVYLFSGLLLFIYSILETRRNIKFCISIHLSFLAFFYLLMHFFSLDLEVRYIIGTLVYISAISTYKIEHPAFIDRKSSFLYLAAGCINAVLAYYNYCIESLFSSFDIVDNFIYISSGLAVVYVIFILYTYGKGKLFVLKRFIPFVGLLAVYLFCHYFKLGILSEKAELQKLTMLFYFGVIMALDVWKYQGFSYSSVILSLLYSLIYYFSAVFNTDDEVQVNLYLSTFSSCSFLILNCIFFFFKKKTSRFKAWEIDAFTIINLMLMSAYFAFTKFEFDIKFNFTLLATAWLILIIFRKAHSKLLLLIKYILLILGAITSLVYCSLLVDSSPTWYILPILVNSAALYLYNRLDEKNVIYIVSYLSCVPIPFALLYEKPELNHNIIYIITYSLIVIIAGASRLKYKIIELKEKIYESRFDWVNILSVIIIFLMIVSTKVSVWRFSFTLLLAAYFLQYAQIEKLKSYALAVTGFCLVIACWLEPWFKVSDLLYLKAVILPLAAWVYSLSFIFKKGVILNNLQIAFYGVFHFILIIEVFFKNSLDYSFILEGICLGGFLWNNIRKNRIYTIISAISASLVVFYMTRDFWFSISWWVYLLVAGLGLIGYAAFNEMKKR
jgi:hypothetical protein